MRELIQIKTKDDRVIYGTLDSVKNSQILLIFVHGLSGSQNEHHYFNAVPFFTEKGFDVFRFNFYAREDKARPLSESSFTTHTEDLQLIVDSFKDKYEKIILVGHSIGAIVILKTDLSNVSKIVLWDPTSGINDISEKNGEYVSALDKYILHWGKDLIISKKMVEEWKSINLDELVKKITVPCKFVFAGETDKYDSWQPFLDKIEVENEHIIVDGATHGFIEEGTEQKLFEETLEWVE